MIYWKLKDVNHETNNENNREITRRGESPNWSIMEHKNMPNGGQKIITIFFSSHSLHHMP